jgi:uncharacterized protein YcfJ
MNILKSTAVLMAAIMTASCAVAPVADPAYSLIDPSGVDPQAYEADYRECAALANQTDTANRAAAAGVGSAVFGALFGALLGAAIGGRSYAQSGAAIGASYGLGAGVGAGVASGETEKAAVLRRCLSGRGYVVVR